MTPRPLVAMRVARPNQGCAEFVPDFFPLFTHPPLSHIILLGLATPRLVRGRRWPPAATRDVDSHYRRARAAQVFLRLKLSTCYVRRSIGPNPTWRKRAR